MVEPLSRLPVQPQPLITADCDLYQTPPEQHDDKGEQVGQQCFHAVHGTAGLVQSPRPCLAAVQIRVALAARSLATKAS